MGSEDLDIVDDELLDRAIAFAEGRRATGYDKAPDHADGSDTDGRFERIAASIRKLDKLWKKPGNPIETVDLASDQTTPDLSDILEFLVAPESKNHDSPAGWTIGRYEIVEELGRGGTGIVFLAIDPALRRHVALKVPRPEALLAPEMRSRFVREAQAAAALNHPNIVPVYETVQIGPLCYIASAYCPGPTLAEWLSSRTDPVPTRTAALCIKSVAEAVEHAHHCGVLHRDLKPANVILSNECRVLIDKKFDRSRHAQVSAVVDNQSSLNPKITDFGLAKLVDHDGDSTHSGAVIGTPKYMAPEQAAGRLRDIGPTADVYALGVILYEMLCGRPPFWGQTNADTCRQVIDDEPVPVRRLRRDVPRDLETICHKCLEKAPGRRYSSAAALADDLGRFLYSEPILARPIRPWERAIKFAKRSPAAAALVAVVMIGIPAVLMAAHLVNHHLMKTRAQEIFNRLFLVDTTGVPRVVHSLQDSLPFIEEDLWKKIASTPDESTDHLRASLALAPRNPLQVDYLQRRIFHVSPAEIGHICDAISDQPGTVVPALMEAACDRQSDRNRRLRAACALARLVPEASEWDQLGKDVAELLVSESTASVLGWAQLLTPVRAKLIPIIKDVFKVPMLQARYGDAAAAVLAEYLAEDLPALVELLRAAETSQWAYLFAKLAVKRDDAISRLEQSLSGTAPDGLSESDKDQHAKGQANVAVALLRLGRPVFVWDRLRADPDPRLRYFLIHRLSPLGADHVGILRRLDSEQDDSIRYALILALADFEFAEISQADQAELKQLLHRLYTDDRDPGVHSAAEWLLSHWEFARKPQTPMLSLEEAVSRNFRWYTTAQGYTMTMVTQPVEFVMGSPSDEQGRAQTNLRVSPAGDERCTT